MRGREKDGLRNQTCGLFDLVLEAVTFQPGLDRNETDQRNSSKSLAPIEASSSPPPSTASRPKPSFLQLASVEATRPLARRPRQSPLFAISVDSGRRLQLQARARSIPQAGGSRWPNSAALTSKPRIVAEGKLPHQFNLPFDRSNTSVCCWPLHPSSRRRPPWRAHTPGLTLCPSSISSSLPLAL
jgi:hypothetical protein